MVGVILASHGDFAEGILQSGSMIFGEQENVQAVTLKPSEGPDVLKNKLKEAISSLDNQEEIVFLVDLWGGTPFNQANSLTEEHKGKWIVVSGLNLPMLIETYSARMSAETAKEVVAEILNPAKEGIKANLEELNQTSKPEKTASNENIAVPVGNGKMKIVLARIDSRLLHGQVATSWTKTTNPNRIIVVSDAVSKDPLRKKFIEQAAPPGVKANVVPISKIIQVSKDPRFGNTRALLLFETPEDVIKAVEGGLELSEVNLGSIAHSVGKVMVNKAVSMDEKDIAAFKKLEALNIKFNVRKVPNDSNENINDLIKKAEEELSKNGK